MKNSSSVYEKKKHTQTTIKIIHTKKKPMCKRKQHKHADKKNTHTPTRNKKTHADKKRKQHANENNTNMQTKKTHTHM